MADETERPESLLPYEEWTEAAMRNVMVRALSFAAEQGLPGNHHFYVTFRTDHPNTVIPQRLRAQYPQQFHPEQLPDEPEEAEPEAPPPAPEPEAPKSETPQVVSLDAFRRRTTPRE